MKGDIQEAWSREQESLSRPTNQALSAEELFRAGVIALAAKAYPEAIRHLEKVSRRPGPLADHASALVAHALSQWRGCQAAGRAMVALQARTQRHDESDPKAIHAWLVLAEHYTRCGDSERAAEHIAAAKRGIEGGGTAETRQYFEQRLRVLGDSP